MSIDARKIRLIMQLRRSGVTDTAVLAVIERLPREVFVPRSFLDQAYEDMALPIGSGQTISQPLVVAMMTQALELHDRLKVLEVGTGSGYQAAVLSRLVRRVYTIERHRALLHEAEARFTSLASQHHDAGGGRHQRVAGTGALRPHSGHGRGGWRHPEDLDGSARPWRRHGRSPGE